MALCGPDSALDLCVRKRALSPDFFYAKKSYVETPTCQYSPVSNSHSDSDASEPYSRAPAKPKGSRPFKAYIKDPLTLAQGVMGVEAFGKDSVEAFTEFRTKILSQVQTNNSGTNKNMRRVALGGGAGRNDDPGYWEKRKKNNEAAKRSRDARRAKEDEIAIRCAFLEQENIQLKYRVASLEAERQRLQQIVYHV